MIYFKTTMAVLLFLFAKSNHMFDYIMFICQPKSTMEVSTRILQAVLIALVHWKLKKFSRLFEFKFKLERNKFHKLFIDKCIAAFFRLSLDQRDSFFSLFSHFMMNRVNFATVT